MPSYVQAPLSIDDFQAVWESVVDPGFAQGFVEAGDGGGFEAYRQAMAQLARVSDAINTTMEAMYILPWSGQTAPPATGPNLAEVELTFSRTLRIQSPLVLGAGTVWYGEIEPESAVDQGTTIATGRRYTLLADLVFLPGQAGPLTATAAAERPGYGYNDPQPGSIRLVEQPGTGYSNAGASIAATTLPPAPGSVDSLALVAAPQAEVPQPQHVGQYFALAAPLGSAAVYRAVAYNSPSPGNGGSVALELVVSFQGATHAGSFVPGEVLTVKNGPTVVAYLTAKAAGIVGSEELVVAVLRSSSGAPVAPGYTVAGQSSGATLTIDMVLGDAPATPSVPIAWRVLDWVQDWGLTVTNAEQPSGGTSAMLDELGYERKIRRSPGEPDALYRPRIATPADTVSPNAVKRALNRTLTKSPEQLSWCFREVGTGLLPGFFYDLDAYDYDAVLLVGSASGAFVDGEQVAQEVGGGLVAQGHALVRSAPPAVPFVPGAAGTTGAPGAPLLLGAAGVQQGAAFVVGAGIVGRTSGAVFTPTIVGTNAGRNDDPGLGNVPGPTRWRVLLDYLRFRAYFAVEVQPSDAGEFGFFWGGAASGVGGGADYWDCAPYPCFYDGWAWTASRDYLAAYHAVDAVRAAGVTFELFQQRGPCV